MCAEATSAALQGPLRVVLSSSNYFIRCLNLVSRLWSDKDLRGAFRVPTLDGLVSSDCFSFGMDFHGFLQFVA